MKSPNVHCTYMHANDGYAETALHSGHFRPCGLYETFGSSAHVTDKHQTGPVGTSRSNIIIGL